MALTPQQVALLFLAYLLLPLLVLLLFWIVGLIRRKVFKKGIEGEGEAAEGEG